VPDRSRRGLPFPPAAWRRSASSVCNRRVPSCSSRRPLSLVDPQGLRMQPGQVGGHRDAEQAPVQVPPTRVSARPAPVKAKYRAASSARAASRARSSSAVRKPPPTPAGDVRQNGLSLQPRLGHSPGRPHDNRHAGAVAATRPASPLAGLQARRHQVRRAAVPGTLRRGGHRLRHRALDPVGPEPEHGIDGAKHAANDRLDCLRFPKTRYSPSGQQLASDQQSVVGCDQELEGVSHHWSSPNRRSEGTTRAVP
jgi:hypothetical protein